MGRMADAIPIRRVGHDGTLGVPVPMTPEQRTQRAKYAALIRWSRENPRESALRAQAGLLDKFLREVDAHEPGLPEAERLRRAECLRRAHMKKLAFKSSRTRGRNARMSDDPHEVSS